jgi:hypothetical protein
VALGSKADFWLVSEGYIPDIELGTALKWSSYYPQVPTRQVWTWMRLVLPHVLTKQILVWHSITSPQVSYLVLWYQNQSLSRGFKLVVTQLQQKVSM